MSIKNLDSDSKKTDGFHIQARLTGDDLDVWESLKKHYAIDGYDLSDSQILRAVIRNANKQITNEQEQVQN